MAKIPLKAEINDRVCVMLGTYPPALSLSATSAALKDWVILETHKLQIILLEIINSVSVRIKDDLRISIISRICVINSLLKDSIEWFKRSIIKIFFQVIYINIIDNDVHVLDFIQHIVSRFLGF